MRKFSFILLLVSVLFFSLSCEKDLELELKAEGGSLVLFSFLSPDSAFNVHLSKSVSHYSVNDFERIYNGVVTVRKNGNFIDRFEFPIDQSWTFRDHIQVNPGDTVLVEASEGDDKIVRGRTIVPFPVPFYLNKVDSGSVDSDFPEKDGVFNNGLVIEDPAGENNYYQLVVFEEICTITELDTICERTKINYPKNDPVFYVRNQDGSLVGGLDFGGCFSDQLFDGESYELNLDLPGEYLTIPSKANTSRKLIFVLISHTRAYYDYYRSRVVAEYGYDIPLIDPIRISNNVEDGLGVVAAYSTSVDSLVFRE